jgi:hypothetical protein
MEEPLTDNLFGDDSATSSDDLLDDERYGTSAAGGETKEPPRITAAAVPSGRVLFVRAISAGEDDDRARSVCGSGGEGIGGGLGGGGEEQPSGIGGGGRIGAAADTADDGEQPNETPVSSRTEAYEGKEGKGDDDVDYGGGGGGGRAEPPRSARPVKTLPSYFGDPLALNNLLRFPHEGRERIERQRVEGRRRRRRDRRPEVQSTFTRMDLEWAVRGYPLQHYVDPQYEPYWDDHEPLIDSEDEEYDPPDDHFTFEAFDALLDAGIDVNGAIGIDPPPLTALQLAHDDAYPGHNAGYDQRAGYSLDCTTLPTPATTLMIAALCPRKRIRVQDSPVAWFDSYVDWSVRVVRRLIDAGAHVDARDKMGRTALMHVAMIKSGDRGIAAIVRELLRGGASVCVRDCSGKTALRYDGGRSAT